MNESFGPGLKNRSIIPNCISKPLTHKSGGDTPGDPSNMEPVNVLFAADTTPAALQVGRRVVIWSLWDSNDTDDTGISSCHDWGSWGFRKKTLHRQADGTFMLLSEDLSGQGMFPDGTPNVVRQHIPDASALEHALSLGRQPQVQLHLDGPVPKHTLALSLEPALRDVARSMRERYQRPEQK